MDTVLPIKRYAETLHWAIALSNDELYSETVRRTIGEYAAALLDCYAFDDKEARLIKGGQ